MPKRRDQDIRNARERLRYMTDPAYRRRALERSRKRNQEAKAAREKLAELEAMPPRLMELVRLLGETK